MIRVGKIHGPEIGSCSAVLWNPILPSIACPQYCAEFTDRRPGIGIGKGDTQEGVGRRARLANPRPASVSCVEDSSRVANSSSVVYIAKGNVLQRKHRNRAGLTNPTGASISGMNDSAQGTNCPASIRADQIMDQGVRLPYLKFPRNPTN